MLIPVDGAGEKAEQPVRAIWQSNRSGLRFRLRRPAHHMDDEHDINKKPTKEQTPAIVCPQCKRSTFMEWEFRSLKAEAKRWLLVCKNPHHDDEGIDADLGVTYRTFREVFPAETSQPEKCAPSPKQPKLRTPWGWLTYEEQPKWREDTEDPKAETAPKDAPPVTELDSTQLPLPGELWFHKKRRAEFEILHLSRAKDTNRITVTYRLRGKDLVWSCPLEYWARRSDNGSTRWTRG